MFHASQKLSLGPSQVMSLSKLLHHPIPLNPRESQKLLNLLTASFRNHLDKEHGPLAAPSKAGASASGTRGSPLANARVPSHTRRHPHSEKHSTDWHMRRMLENPLFSRPDGKLFQGSKDPMDVFEAAVGKGMMDLKAAYGCLRAKKEKIIYSNTLTVRQGMGDSKFGTRVVQWLRSSGIVNTREFMHDEAFGIILMEYLIAEGNEEACWTFIRLSFEDCQRLLQIPRYSDERRALGIKIRMPLMNFTRALATRPASLDAAYLALNRASGYILHLSLEQKREILGPCILVVVGLTKSLDPDRPISTETNFESFLQLIPFSRGRCENDLAHLWLLHPSRPNVDRALKILRQVHTDGLPRYPTFRHSRGARTQEDMQNRIMYLGLKTAEFLLNHDRYHEADEVMACLRQHFGRQLGLSVQSQERLKDAEAEAASIAMLDNLEFA